MMMITCIKMKFVGIVIYLIWCLSKVNGQSSEASVTNDDSTTNEYPTLQHNWTYCYEFTWFGPDYDKVKTYNGTCSDYLEETRATGIPCAPPIVISEDGTFPDIEYLWNKHRSSVLCKRSDNQRCVKYTYLFNNKPNNITYMCAKVRAHDGSHIDDGCYTESLSGGYKTEICICKSSPGLYQPCNSATKDAAYLGLAFISALLMLKVCI